MWVGTNGVVNGVLTTQEFHRKWYFFQFCGDLVTTSFCGVRQSQGGAPGLAVAAYAVDTLVTARGVNTQKQNALHQSARLRNRDTRMLMIFISITHVPFHGLSKTTRQGVQLPAGRRDDRESHRIRRLAENLIRRWKEFLHLFTNW